MEDSALNEKHAIEQAALERCEEQVLHDIGFIQDFAYLLAFKQGENIFTHVSANITDVFNEAPSALLGQTIDCFLPATIVHACNNAAAHSTIENVREFVGTITNETQSFEAYVHKQQDALILELQATNNTSAVGLQMLDKVQRLLSRLQMRTTIQDLLEAAVVELRALSGFDRVKVYQFLPDGAGEVIAESRDAMVDSFLGLRFPAYDVPKGAKKLYAKTPIRIITSTTADAIPIVKQNKYTANLDLSLAISRATVSAHAEYLKNMGVCSSMSVSIIIDGKMWGLFACHHHNKYTPSAEIISSAEILGNAISLMIKGMIQRQQSKHFQQASTIVNQLFVADDSALGYTAYWDKTSIQLLSLIDSDGLSLCSPDNIQVQGDCPPKDSIRQLLTLLDKKQEKLDENEAIAIESINAFMAELNTGKTAGVLALPAPAFSYQYLLFFRNSSSAKVRWAGAPKKRINKDDEGFRLNPRASFAEYIEEHEGKCDSFTDNDFMIAKALQDAFSKSTSSISQHKQQRDRLGLMVRELNHRVRNLLALIGSIVSQSRREYHDIESFIESIESRIQALSETHKLLTEFEWLPIDINLFFNNILSPHQHSKRPKITTLGDPVSIPPELASLLALVVHELASNATKYGALSVPTGRVKLNWEHTQENLNIKWEESNGPFVEKPSRIGFGTTLIKEALSYEFDAHCDIQFRPKGVLATFVLPLSKVDIVKLHKSTLKESSLKESKRFNALILEDDFIIAKDMSSMLRSFGAQSVDAASSIEKAKQLINAKKFDFAVLDANIRGEYSGAVADLLSVLSVPFVYVTGYGSKHKDLHKTDCISVLTKPITKNQLLSVLQDLKLIEDET